MGQPLKKRRYFRSRPEEFRLLIIAVSAVILLTGAAILSVMSDRNVTVADGALTAAFVISALLAHGLLVMFGSGSDPVLLPSWIFLSGTGLAFQLRLQTFDGSMWRTPGCWSFQAAPLIMVITALIFGRDRLKSLARLYWIWILSAFGICLLVLTTGVQYRGGVYGPGRTTPTEAVKFLLIIGFSGLLTKYGHQITRGTRLFSAESRRVHIMLVGAWLLPVVVLAILGDLGMMAGTGLLLCAMITMATFRWIYPVGGLATVVAGGWMVQNFLGKGRLRFGAWMNPFENPDSSGFQTIRSLFAIFNGEFIGRGLGNGFPRTIPLVETDFVYASIAEEFGWIGTGLLLWIVLIIIRRCFRIAADSKNSFCALVCIGCGSMWMIQVLLHVGGVIKLIPMTGVPFPGLSTGGSATIVFAVLCGLVMGASDGKPSNTLKA